MIILRKLLIRKLGNSKRHLNIEDGLHLVAVSNIFLLKIQVLQITTTEVASEMNSVFTSSIMPPIISVQNCTVTGKSQTYEKYTEA